MKTSTKFVHSCVSYAKLYNLKHIFHSYFRFNQHILKNILKMSIKIVHTFILYFQINLAMNLTFCFYSYFKIQSKHYVKLYVSCLCIPNVVFDFCVLLQIMFFNTWGFFPVSTMNIIASLRSYIVIHNNNMTMYDYV